MGFVVLILIGLITGAFGALLGLGGSIILIPALNQVFGPHQHLHQTCAMILNLAVVSAAAYGHGKAGVLRYDILKSTIPAAICGVIVGVELSELRLFEGERERLLTALFGVFLLCAAGFNLKRILRPSATIGDENPPATAVRSWKAVLLVGAPTGLLSGLLGVGGGIIAVPAQQIFLRVGLRQAIGNSAATICGLSLVGALTKNYHWWASHGDDPFAPLTIAAFVVPGAVLGGLIGSRLTHVIAARWLGGSLVVVLAIAGVRQLSYWLGS
jgi:uncharacterized membrane protein YfcA